jgi:hypothetical protein
MRWGWGWAIALAAGAYVMGRVQGQTALMEALKEAPPDAPPTTVVLSDEEEQAIIDMVESPGGGYTSKDTGRGDARP